MDNVTFHKCTTIKEFIIASGHTVRYLPSHLPALNPIEEAFSKWKNVVRRSNCMSSDDLSVVIESGFDSITTDDCDGYYKHMKMSVRKTLNKENLEE